MEEEGRDTDNDDGSKKTDNKSNINGGNMVITALVIIASQGVLFLT